jgi:FKBP-type peptidyl-prolyl cis-trans isomerase
MIKNEEVKTSPKQRIIIILIAIFMLGSTFALYAGIVLNYNKPAETTEKSEKQARFDELYAEYQGKLDEQAKTLSTAHYQDFLQYRGRVKSFNKEGVNILKVEDLRVGTGRELTEITDYDYAAYYIGWMADEKVFDSSFDNYENPTALDYPLTGSSSMIQGWLEGISRNTDDNGKVLWEGMRIGGVREITIPAAMAYGDITQGDIPAGSPLKFVVMLIEKPEEVPVSDELQRLYGELYG